MKQPATRASARRGKTASAGRAKPRAATEGTPPAAQPAEVAAAAPAKPAAPPADEFVARMEKVRRQFEVTWAGMGVAALIGVVGGVSIVFFDGVLGEDPLDYVYFGLGGGITVPTYYWLISTFGASLAKNAIAFRQQTTVQAKSDALQEEIDQDFFTNLVKINFKYIDKYYLQTQIQADKSFLVTVLAAGVGFLILIAGIVMMFLGKIEPGYVTAAAGLISQFISAVFFYLYNKTIVSMAGYHRKLVLTQNVGLALRIAQEMPEAKRIAAQEMLVDRLSSEINALLAADGD